AQRLESAHRVAAHDEVRRALHEERHVLGGDDILNLVAKLVQLVPFVFTLTSETGPPASGAPSASLTSRCCSISGSPSKRVLATVTWKWSPPPVRSSTDSSAASGNACSRSGRSRSSFISSASCAAGGPGTRAGRSGGSGGR